VNTVLHSWQRLTVWRSTRKKTVIAEGEKEKTQREGQPCERLDVPEESRARVRHDSWMVGDEPYVSLHFMGAEKYAKAKK